MGLRVLLIGTGLALLLGLAPRASACPFCRADSTGLGAPDSPVHDRPFQVSGGVDQPSAFFFRGYLQADQGPILQPYLNVFTKHVFEEDVVVRPYVSLFHSANFDADNRMNDMSDVMVGAVISGHAFSIDARYAYFTMNQLMRSRVDEFGVKASYDVLTLCNSCNEPSPFSLRPFVGAYFDLFDEEGTEDIFINVGLEPSWRCELAGFKIGLSLPTDWGLSADGYYLNADGTNAGLGYFSTALTSSVLLPSRGCGQWFLNTSVQYLHLTADSVLAINDGDADVCIGKIGLSFVY